MAEQRGRLFLKCQDGRIFAPLLVADDRPCHCFAHTGGGQS